jgi:hypothetical protein
MVDAAAVAQEETTTQAKEADRDEPAEQQDPGGAVADRREGIDVEWTSRMSSRGISEPQRSTVVRMAA